MFLALQYTNEANKRERKTLSCVLWSQESNLTPQSSRGKSNLQRAKALEIGRIRGDQAIKTHKLLQLYTRISLITELGIKMSHYCSRCIYFKQPPPITWHQVAAAVEGRLEPGIAAEQSFFPAPRRYEPSGEVGGCHQYGALVSCSSSRLQGHYNFCTGAAVLTSSLLSFPGKEMPDFHKSDPICTLKGGGHVCRASEGSC